MKKLLAITTIALVSVETATAQRRGPVRKHNFQEKRAENSALREEFRLDKRDTHGAQVDPGKDVRPEDFEKYHKATYARIVSLLKAGKIDGAQGTDFKLAHTEVTNLIKEAKATTDGLTKGRKASLRKDLDEINDDINKIAGAGDEGDKRTPMLNIAQHKFEEAIEFGKRSGRLSTGEASRLTRKLESLERLEERIKSGSSLSERERVKLHEEALEIRRELVKELKD